MSNAKIVAYYERAYPDFAYCETASGGFMYNEQTGEVVEVVY